MIANDDFTTTLRAWLDDEARAPVPAMVLERALEVTAGRRPRHPFVAAVASHWSDAGPVDPMRPRARQPLASRGLVLLTLIALLAGVVAGGAILVGRRADERSSPQALPSMPATSRSPETRAPSATATVPAVTASSAPPWGDVSGSWPGPLHSVPKGAVKTSDVRPSGTIWWQDKGDVALDWIDISRVTTGGGAGWSIVLRARPPDPAELDVDDVVSYGFVFDTTGDGEADYVLGIDSGIGHEGDLRTWITDLATGETEGNVRPPYGLPFDFRHPNGTKNSPTLGIWFMPGSAPHGL